MKTALSLGLALLAFVPARAQLFRPDAVNGALLGGIAGAVIGHNSGDLGHNAWRGAAIGTAAGLVLGDVFGSAYGTNQAQVAASGGYVYRQAPTVSIGYGIGYGRRGRVGSGNYGASFGYYPGYDAGYYPYGDGYYGSGSAAANGLWLGALAGGIIGHNSGEFRHNGWQGAAWGAGLGYLLGSVVDASRPAVAYQRPVVVQPAVQSQAAPSQPQPVTIINNYYNAPATPMSAANGLFGRN